MRTILVGLALTLALPAAVGAATATTPPDSTSPTLATAGAQSSTHKDERFGYQFRPPKRWKSIALKSDEMWLTAKFLSDKSYFYTDETGWTYEHTPEVMVIAFQHENQRRKKDVTEEEEDGVKVTTIVINNPYKDYEDFLDRTYAGGGWYVDKKEEAEHGDLKVTQYEVKVEKLARTGPKRIVTWMFHTEDIDYAMQFEFLESEYRAAKKMLERSLKSFEEVERNGELLPKGGKTVGDITFTRKELTAGTPKERRTVRMKSQRDLHDKAIAGLPKDWDHKYYGDVLVLEHEEDKWAKRLGEHLELLLKHIEDTFGYFGEDEYARAPVVRVCDDEEEAAAFNRGVVSGSSGGGMSWTYPGSEIVTYKDDAGFIGYQVEHVNRQLLSLWMQERDEDLASALPEWVSIGVYEYFGGARRDGRKLEFRKDQSDWDAARLAIAQDRNAPLRELMKLTREEFMSNSGGTDYETYMNRRADATMFARWLLSNESRRCKQAKTLLEDYITNLGEVLVEVKEKENDSWANEKDPDTEEEEEELARARSERWQAREKELMVETYERTFGDWSEKDWASLQKAYEDWL